MPEQAGTLPEIGADFDHVHSKGRGPRRIDRFDRTRNKDEDLIRERVALPNENLAGLVDAPSGIRDQTPQFLVPKITEGNDRRYLVD